MILFLSNGEQIRGDLLTSAVLRSDLSPVPVTLEADIRAGDEIMDGLLAEGKTITDAYGSELQIVKSVRVSNREVQGPRERTGFRITALLAACAPIAYVRSRAIIKENCTLAAVYRAAGATIGSVENDFPVKRFCCPIGETPSFHIARVLQEAGGIVRWKGSRLQFIGLTNLFSQKSVRTVPSNAAENVQTGFLERHQVPWFFSLNESAGFVFGNREKARSVRFSPFKSALELHNMTRCLVQAKIARLDFDVRIRAGDIIEDEAARKYAIITAAHVYRSGEGQGGTPEAFSKLWLGVLEG